MQASIHRAELRSSLRTFAGEEIEIKDRVALMLFKLNSVFVSTGRDSDKPEKIIDSFWLLPVNIVLL